MDPVNPTARALACLQVLQDQPGITAARLGRALGCSDRAAPATSRCSGKRAFPYRRCAGPTADTGSAAALRPPPVMFSATEALALVMAVLDGHHDAGDETAR